MARINSRKKGARGEKKACEVFQKWTSFKFHRVPQSGGLHWKLDNTCGDIICGDPLHRFDFSIEVKNYADINFEHLLMPHVNCDIMGYWAQCIKDAERGKKLPLLLMRYDGMAKDLFFAVIEYSHFKLIKHLLDKKLPYFKYGKLIFMHSGMLFNSDYKQVKKITHKIIRRLWK